MSYSFNLKARTKVEVLEKAAAEFDKIVVAQPSHEADRKAAISTVEAYVGLILPPREDQEITLSVYGSLSWRDEGQFTHANISVTVGVGLWV